jgi:hypothetical protein
MMEIGWRPVVNERRMVGYIYTRVRGQLFDIQTEHLPRSERYADYSVRHAIYEGVERPVLILRSRWVAVFSGRHGAESALRISDNT